MDSELLIRLDERSKGLQKQLEALESHVVKSSKETKEAMEEYVTHAEFAPVKMLTFGLAGLILSTIISAALLQAVILPIFKEEPTISTEAVISGESK